MNEQYNPETAKKQKVRLPLSAYLSYLLIATLLLTGLSFSKFASSGSAGDDARVAVVVVDGGSYGDETDLSIGGDSEAIATYSFYLTNYNEYDYVASEVSLDYTVFVTMPDGRNLPAGVEMSLTYYYDEYDENGDLQGTVEKDCLSIPSGEDGVYTFDGGADFAAGEWEYHDYILTFTVIDESLITENASFEGIEISVTAEQID